MWFVKGETDCVSFEEFVVQFDDLVFMYLNPRHEI